MPKITHLTPEEAPASGAVPPYLAFRTFMNFLDGLKANGEPPGRIDRSVLGSFSGGVQTQLISALRYLGMVTPTGAPTNALQQMIKLEGEELQKYWQTLMRHSYPYVFEHDFSLQNATTKQLEEKFSHVATGDTVRKCLSFFILAATFAGFQMSPYLKTVKAKRGMAARPRRTPSLVTVPPIEPPGGADTVTQSWQEMLLAKFPSFDPAWSDDVKAKWFDAFDKLMKQGLGGAA